MGSYHLPSPETILNGYWNTKTGAGKVMSMMEQAQPATTRTPSPGARGRSRRFDLRGVEPAVRSGLLVSAFAALAPEQGFSFLSSCDEHEVLAELQRQHGNEVEWFALEEGPEVWDVVVCRCAPGVRRRQVMDFIDRKSVV